MKEFLRSACWSILPSRISRQPCQWNAPTAMCHTQLVLDYAALSLFSLSFPVFSPICSPFLSFTSSVQLGSHYLPVMGSCSYHLPVFTPIIPNHTLLHSSSFKR